MNLDEVIQLLLVVAAGFALYWVVRLAVRHGGRDADARRDAPPRPAPPTEEPPAAP